MIKTAIFPAVRMLVVLTVLTGIVYPLVITLAAGLFFPAQANGSLLTVNGQVVGSALIGQAMDSDRYFSARPSAMVDANGTPAPYGETNDGSIVASTGSNLGPTSAALQKAMQDRIDAIRQKYSLAADTPIPPDLIFASASGLDPHISPAAAQLQIDRIARVRGLTRDQVVELVNRMTEGPQFGLFGQRRVNVLLLNLALDQVK